MRALAAVAIALLLSTGCSRIAEQLDWIGSDPSAEWIRVDQPAQLGIYVKPRMMYFMRRFHVERDTDTQLHLRAMRQVVVYLDDQRIFRTSTSQVGWIGEQIIDLSPYLTRGDHTLLIKVFNRSGANLLLAYAPTLDIATGRSWLGSADGKH